MSERINYLTRALQGRTRRITPLAVRGLAPRLVSHSPFAPAARLLEAQEPRRRLSQPLITGPRPSASRFNRAGGRRSALQRCASAAVSSRSRARRAAARPALKDSSRRRLPQPRENMYIKRKRQHRRQRAVDRGPARWPSRARRLPSSSATGRYDGAGHRGPPTSRRVKGVRLPTPHRRVHREDGGRRQEIPGGYFKRERSPDRARDPDLPPPSIVRSRPAVPQDVGANETQVIGMVLSYEQGESVGHPRHDRRPALRAAHLGHSVGPGRSPPFAFGRRPAPPRDTSSSSTRRFAESEGLPNLDLVVWRDGADAIVMGRGAAPRAALRRRHDRRAALRASSGRAAPFSISSRRSAPPAGKEKRGVHVPPGPRTRAFAARVKETALRQAQAGHVGSRARHERFG